MHAISYFHYFPSFRMSQSNWRGKRNIISGLQIWYLSPLRHQCFITIHNIIVGASIYRWGLFKIYTLINSLLWQKFGINGSVNYYTNKHNNKICVWISRYHFIKSLSIDVHEINEERRNRMNLSIKVIIRLKNCNLPLLVFGRNNYMKQSGILAFHLFISM